MLTQDKMWARFFDLVDRDAAGTLTAAELSRFVKLAKAAETMASVEVQMATAISIQANAMRRLTAIEAAPQLESGEPR